MPRSRAEHINQKPPFDPSQLSLVKPVRKYDMVFNHHVFDPRLFDYLHDDTFKFTTLREPFHNFLSAFWYYRVQFKFLYLIKIPGSDPVTELLKNPSKYETEPYRSMTKNRQCLDLGYDAKKGFEDSDYVDSFIDQTERRFDLVLITEYFDESLIVLKRALRWRTEDILYLSKNKGEYYGNVDKDAEMEPLRRRLHANISQPDIRLYNHFLSRFKQRMKDEPGLKEEVKEFRDILTRLRDFCQYFISSLSKNLVIPKGTWNNGFYVSPYKCKWLKLKEFELTNFLQTRQQTLFKNG